MRSIRPWATAVAALALVLAPLTPLAAVRAQGAQTLLNVSYDPTRELWRDINASFIPLYEKQSGTKLTIRQSHAGSSSQARGRRRPRSRRRDDRVDHRHRRHRQAGPHPRAREGQRRAAGVGNRTSGSSD